MIGKYIHREDICVHQFIPEKDYTDTDIAVKLALKLFAENPHGEIPVSDCPCQSA